jgi:hypothetical protein
MTTRKETPAAGANSGGREQCDAQSDATALPQYIDGCAIFKLAMPARIAATENANARLREAALELDIDPLPGRCAACGLRLDRAPRPASLRNGAGQLVAVHLSCRAAMRTGWRP